MGHSYVGAGDVQSYDPFWDKALWYLKFAWWPQRSEISKKRIWLKKAYRGTRLITGPGEPVIEHRWLTKEEYIFGKIKGTL